MARNWKSPTHVQKTHLSQTSIVHLLGEGYFSQCAELQVGQPWDVVL